MFYRKLGTFEQKIKSSVYKRSKSFQEFAERNETSVAFNGGITYDAAFKNGASQVLQLLMVAIKGLQEASKERYVDGIAQGPGEIANITLHELEILLESDEWGKKL